MSGFGASEDAGDRSEVGRTDELVCRYCGRTLSMRRVGGSVGILLCPDEDCIYPLDQADLSPFLVNASSQWSVQRDSSVVPSSSTEPDEFDRTETEQPNPEPAVPSSNAVAELRTETATTGSSSSGTAAANPSMFRRSLYMPPLVDFSFLPMKSLSFSPHK